MSPASSPSSRPMMPVISRAKQSMLMAGFLCREACRAGEWANGRPTRWTHDRWGGKLRAPRTVLLFELVRAGLEPFRARGIPQFIVRIPPTAPFDRREHYL